MKTKERIPDWHLPKLHRQLRALQREAAKNGEAYSELMPDLNDAIRRVALVELLGTKSFAALAGLQGAGKSTIAVNLYRDKKGVSALDGLIPTNPGRGERLPIIIEEDSAAREIGLYGITFADKHDLVVTADNFPAKALDRAEFQRQSTGHSDDFVLLKIVVPGEHVLGAGLALLVLPGFESAHEKEAWQQFVWIAVEMSRICAFVFDGPTYAADENRQVLERIKKSHAERKTPPVFLLSRSDGVPDGNELLKATVLQDFNLPKDLVICTGTADWAARAQQPVKVAFAKLTDMPLSAKARQVARIEAEILPAVDAAIVALEVVIQEAEVIPSAEETHVKKVIALLREHRSRTFDDLKSTLERIFESHKNTAMDMFNHELAGRDTPDRVKNWFQKFFHPVRGEVELDDLISSLWKKSSKISDRERFVDGITSLLRKRLPILCAGSGSEASDVHSLISYAPPKEQLAQITPEVLDCLKILFVPDPSGKRADLSSPHFARALELAPLLAIEAVRLANALGDQLPVVLRGAERGSAERGSAERGLEWVPGLRDTKGVIVSALGVVLGIDLAADNQADTLGGLFTSLGMNTAAAAAFANWCTVAIGLAAVINMIRGELVFADYRDKATATIALEKIKEAYVTEMLRCSDEALDFVEERIVRTLGETYHLTSALGDREKLIRRLANAKSAVKQMRESCYVYRPAVA